MNLKLFISILFLSFLGFSQKETSEKKFNMNLKGLAFGDAYYVDSHHLPEENNIGGAVLRRGYLTLDLDYNKWFSRIRVEANQSGEYQVYEYELDWKDLFVGYNFQNHKLVVGLSPTKTFDLIERVWQKRYLVRTPMDLQGIPSRDAGIALDGYISRKTGVKYRTMISKGADFGNETGDGSKFQAALSWQINKNFLFDFYADYEQLPGDTDRSTYQFFGAYVTDKFRVGIQYSNQYRQEDPELELFSTFITHNFKEKYTLIGRVDRILEPSPEGNNISYIPFDPSTTSTFLIGGFEYKLNNFCVLTPNIIHIVYDEDSYGNKPKNDLTYRLTFYFKFD